MPVTLIGAGLRNYSRDVIISSYNKDLGHNPTTDPLIKPSLELTMELCISSKVLFTDRVIYSDVARYPAASDIGISYLPLGTPHQYHPPTKLIEYMMAGIVATINKIPAIDELVTDNVDGILFSESEEDIASGLRRSLDLWGPDNQDSYLPLTTNAQHAVRNRD